ncbi:12355_t:CDS:10 [Cetraspora pellucida]|uniref:12355_t:CDS:1 n=1 Tax=Cetraspora pellucida TaxID=1433469 RepID=A0A9N8VVE6_9GLOM|nr:12355_t:CDS:10 [Cetraspora pellucida]
MMNPFKSLLLAFVWTLLGSTICLVVADSAACNPSNCKAPTCFCPGITPPGGLSLDDTPQFFMLTYDDSIQDRTMSVVNKLMGTRKNPNGCPISATYYVSIQYTNMSMVTEWYARGQEVADHTMTHVGKSPENEITGCKAALNAFAGLPNGNIKGFRTPFLDWTPEVLQTLAKLGFQYDSSVTALKEDASWPYTLDYGLYNDCWKGFCNSTIIPGFFEIPMAALIDEQGLPHLMDPYLDNTTDVVKKWLQDNFNRHLTQGKTPFGVYIHPVQLDNSTAPGRNTEPMIQMLQEFFDWALAQPNVWFVTSQQLLTWMKNPVPASQLKDYAPFKCQAPKIDKKICNGLTDDGLLETCTFPNGSWSTCYGCPTSDITLDNPVPPGGDRHRLPTNCETVWWDPIGNSCLCTNASCAYVDTSVPMPTQSSNNSGSNPTNNGQSNGQNGQKSDATQNQNCSSGEVKQKSISDFFKPKNDRFENSSDDDSGNVIVKRQKRQAYPLIPRFNSENNTRIHSDTASPPRKRVKQTEQMFLDFGQKNFGVYTCPECHMLYSRGTVEDEVVHAKYHKAVVRGITYTSYKHEIMLKQFPDDNSRVMMLIYDQSNPFEKRKILQILNVIDTELNSIELSEQKLDQCKIYLYVTDKKKVEGCVIAEPITRAYRISRSDDSTQVEKMQVGTSNNGSAVFCFTKPIQAVCGINRIWVSRPHRRKGIATKLLNVVREKFMYGCILKPSDLAFSQPTGDGQAFAAHYTGVMEFLVYAEN